MTQLSLALDSPVSQGRSRRTDPRTSIEAARTCGADAQRAQIVRLLAANTQGMTADELAGLMYPIPHRSSVAARLAQLASDENGRQVYAFGVRLNHRNRPVRVWFKRYEQYRDVPTGEYL